MEPSSPTHGLGVGEVDAGVVDAGTFVKFMAAFAGAIHAPQTARLALEQGLQAAGLNPCLLPAPVSATPTATKAGRNSGKASTPGGAGDKDKRHHALSLHIIFQMLLGDYEKRHPSHPALQRQLVRDEHGNPVLDPKTGKAKEVRGSAMVVSSGVWKSLTEAQRAHFKSVVQPFLDVYNKQQAQHGAAKPESLLSVMHDFLQETDQGIHQFDPMCKSAADAYAKAKGIELPATAAEPAPASAAPPAQVVSAPHANGTGPASQPESQLKSAKKRKHKDQDGPAPAAPAVSPAAAPVTAQLVAAAPAIVPAPQEPGSPPKDKSKKKKKEKKKDKKHKPAKQATDDDED